MLQELKQNFSTLDRKLLFFKDIINIKNLIYSNGINFWLVGWYNFIYQRPFGLNKECWRNNVTKFELLYPGGFNDVKACCLDCWEGRC